MTTIQTVISKPAIAENPRAFWIIFVPSYAVFLAIALMGTVLGWHWRSWLPGAEGVKSIFGGVKAAVYTFMSHLT